MGLDAKERQDLSQARKQQVRDMVDASTRALDDEVRYCTRCGWKARKSDCVRTLEDGTVIALISKCPKCGNTECVAQSMDYGLNPAEVRRLQKEGGGGAR
jgi:ribosomal protein S27AE